MIDYVVRGTTDDLALRDAFVAWLKGGHVADVIRAGALDGHVVIEDGGPPYAVEVRYTFASRAAFAAYERDHAPRLREEGKRVLGTMTLARRTGERAT